MNDELNLNVLESDDLANWVMSKVGDWKTHYEARYHTLFREYYRIWRGIYDPADKTRQSERSQIISPATSQAIESSVAEVEEATFNRGHFFDIRDDLLVIPDAPEGMNEEQFAAFQQWVAGKEQEKQQSKARIKYLREKLSNDFQRQKIRQQMGEVLINAAVYGTGIAEVVIDVEAEKRPVSKQMGNVLAGGVDVKDRTVVKLKPVPPENFRIDPLATSVEDSIGVAIDENVSPHAVQMLQENGTYRDIPLGTVTAAGLQLDIDPDATSQSSSVVRLVKYYGLVPRKLLEKYESADFPSELETALKNIEPAEDETAVEGLEPEIETDSAPYFVEACVVIANGTTILKAQENPFMMQDRPVIAFPWDVVPGRFWGRGVCEKSFHSQKALDTELRARIDALALTNSPMMAMDATKMPRGVKNFVVRPGKTILTNGRPTDALMPFNFGQVSQITFAQAEALQRMVQTATGAIDSAGIPGSINGQSTAAGISMSLSAIIKRHKRTLVNFQQGFLIPFVKMAAYRYMQFDTENYPVADYTFEVTSTLGIIAREYEVSQLVQLLQTMSQESPIYPVMIKSIIENMSLSNRDELNALIDATMKPDPQQQQAAKAQADAAMGFQASQTAALEGQADESQARARKIATETRAIPVELENDRIKSIASVTRAEGELDKDTRAKLKIAEVMIKEKKVGIDEASFRLGR